MSLWPGLATCQVWQFSLDDEAWDQGNGWLSAEEWQGFERLKVLEHQRRSRRARIALRGLLGLAWGLAPQRLLLQRGPFGKPWVHGVPGHFNLSHSGGLAWLALGPEPVGLDGESEALLGDDLAGLMDIVCHAEEQQAAPLDLAQRRRWFCRLWTQKEAYCKALGLGFQINPLQLCVKADEGGDAVRDERPGGAVAHRLCSLPAPAGHALSLCVLGRTVTGRVQPTDAKQTLSALAAARL